MAHPKLFTKFFLPIAYNHPPPSCKELVRRTPSCVWSNLIKIPYFFSNIVHGERFANFVCQALQLLATISHIQQT